MSINYAFEATLWGLASGVCFSASIVLSARAICQQQRSLIGYLFKFIALAALGLGLYRSDGLWQVLLPSFLLSAVLFLGAAMLARRRGLG